MQSSRLSQDSELERASRILVGILEDGPLAAGEVERQASEFGVTLRTLRRAKEVLKVRTSKEASETGRWVWELPERPKSATVEVESPTVKDAPRLSWVSCLRCGEFFQKAQPDFGADGSGVVIGGYCDPCTKKESDECEERMRRRAEAANREQARVDAVFHVGRPHYRDKHGDWITP